MLAGVESVDLASKLVLRTPDTGGINAYREKPAHPGRREARIVHAHFRDPPIAALLSDP